MVVDGERVQRASRARKSFEHVDKRAAAATLFRDHVHRTSGFPSFKMPLGPPSSAIRLQGLNAGSTLNPVYVSLFYDTKRR